MKTVMDWRWRVHGRRDHIPNAAVMRRDTKARISVVIVAFDARRVPLVVP
jgi:hypothetical protein